MPRKPRVLGRIMLAVALCSAAAGVGWAAQLVGRATAAPPASPDFTTVVSHPGSVGLDVPIRVSIDWRVSAVVRNQAAGVITSIDIDDSAKVSSGQQLYSVDLHPVVIAEGATPMFRDLEEGTVGPDVRQLQSMLRSLGFLELPADGIFGPRTVQAVREWQAERMQEPTGVVLLGAIAFVSQTPSVVSLDKDSIALGAAVSGGEEAIRVTSPDPELSASLARDQFVDIAVGSTVTIPTPEGDWHGEIGALSHQGDGNLKAVLRQSKRSSCGLECPFTVSSSDAIGSITVVPRAEGVIVPTAAIMTRGSTALVVDREGSEHLVEILASADGESAISGLRAGTVVRIRGAR